jgi:hypothetical protein
MILLGSKTQQYTDHLVPTTERMRNTSQKYNSALLMNRTDNKIQPNIDQLVQQVVKLHSMIQQYNSA